MYPVELVYVQPHQLYPSVYLIYIGINSLQNATSTTASLGVVWSVAVVFESVDIEVRLCVLPFVHALRDRHDPYSLSLN